LKSIVNVRRFLKGVDEPVWVELLNAEYREFASWWRGTTVEEMVELEKNPSFDFEGRFVAEFDGKLAGVIHAHVEKSGTKKGVSYGIFVFFRLSRVRGLKTSLWTPL
jgi:hypothetical protein